MSDFQEFLEEKEKIDSLVNQGYRIEHITENLSGAFVDFKKSKEVNEYQQLHIKTAEGRKYFSVFLLEAAYISKK
ncbi:hypothetical protein SAMN05443252_105385 [Bacillus sp. OV322]|uniref:hypothetical protein n=1 Tax=Bacillus sp. OV322 TaxID=1882764 RepID=UPI0008EB84EB|nr:hypothetical protein [Bacillus sp. OV322]SFC70562.1 hypothetical protein SAMN05443252_105385 [Bacillus sp. OV322]